MNIGVLLQHYTYLCVTIEDPSPLSTFAQLGLSEQISQTVSDMGFVTPTPIQSQAIPLLLQEPTDFIGLAQTGTGKTAAFGLPLIEWVDDADPGIQGLIMAPTRELGQQTANELHAFSKGASDLNVECVYGGANISNQIKALKRPVHILVATPGRLLDLLRRKALSLETVRFVILDEADEMLNMGFQEDIDSILEEVPEQRSIWLFSATMPKEIRRIIKKYMSDPKEVAVNTEHKLNTDISHRYVMTRTADKTAALRRFLDVEPDMKGVLFCRTKRQTQQLADELGDEGYHVEALHGDLSQAQRDAVMKRFKARSMQLLIATDVAARGIDVRDLTHVMHYNLPDQREAYTHRSGRTGRAGKSGVSLAFINSREDRKIKDLERRMKVQFERVLVPSIEDIRSSRLEHWAKNLLRETIHDKATDEAYALRPIIGHLEKEELVQRLISRELHRLERTGKDHQGDLNIGQKKGKGKDEDERSPFNRYFINIGSMDGFNRADIMNVITDFGNLARKDVGEVSVQKNCTFFDVVKGKDSGLSQMFNGLELDNRSLRVNRDSEGPRAKGRGERPFKHKGREVRGKKKYKSNKNKRRR